MRSRLFTLLATSYLLLAVFAAAIPAPAYAIHVKGYALLPSPNEKCPGKAGAEGKTFGNDECGTADVFIWIFIRWGNFMIGGAGAFALFFFVVGGFMMMISAGRAEMVQRGKAILIGSVIGLILVFAAQLFVSFFLKTFLEGSTNATAVNNQTELNLEVKVK